MLLIDPMIQREQISQSRLYNPWNEGENFKFNKARVWHNSRYCLFSFLHMRHCKVTPIPVAANLISGKQHLLMTMWIAAIQLAGRSATRLFCNTLLKKQPVQPGAERATNPPVQTTTEPRRPSWGSCSHYKTVQSPQRLIFPLAPPKQEEEGGE